MSTAAASDSQSQPHTTRKAKWSVRLALLSCFLYFAPWLVPRVVNRLSEITGKHIHSQVRLFSTLWYVGGATGAALAVAAIILGAFAIHDTRRSPGELRARGIASFGLVAAGISLFILAIMGCDYQNSRDAARMVQCKCLMKQICLALYNYHDRYKSIPPAAVYDAEGRPLLSWRVLVLPFLSQEDGKLYQQFHLDEPWDSPHNLLLADRMPGQFRCPSDTTSKPNATSYVAVTGEGTFFPPGRTVTVKDVKDGTANTIMFGEILSSTIVWTKPEDVVFDDKFDISKFSSLHSRGPQFCFGDGTQRPIRNTIDPKVFRALATIAGGEQIDVDDL